MTRYPAFLQKRRYNELVFQGRPVAQIIKEYYPEYSKNQIYRWKRRMIQYLDAYPNKDPDLVIGYVLVKELEIPISMIIKR